MCARLVSKTYLHLSSFELMFIKVVTSVLSLPVYAGGTSSEVERWL